MEDKIKEALSDPETLEKLYRQNKPDFKRNFTKITAELTPTDIIRFWQIRLNTSQPQKIDFIPLIFSMFMVLLLSHIPQILQFSEGKIELFNLRNLILIAFAGLTFYEMLKNKSIKFIYLIAFLVFYCLMTMYLNIFQTDSLNQTLTLALLHTPILCWYFYGMVYNSRQQNNKHPWVSYLRYNGDLMLFSGLIMICWLTLIALTVILFESLNMDISDSLLLDLFVTSALISPIIASFAIERIPTLANKFVPLIARIFNPILLIVLIIYLVIINLAGNNVYYERDFLIIFNLILFIVLLVILFSLSNIKGKKYDRFQFIVLLLLTFFACALNVTALSAFIYRIYTYGITPNKMAVTGMNIIIFINLIKIGINLLQVQISKRNPESVIHCITSFLPFYTFWAFVVVVIFPILFK